MTWVLLSRLTHSSHRLIHSHQDLKEFLEAPPVLGTSLFLGNSQGTALATALAAQGRLVYRLQLFHSLSTRHHREGSTVGFFSLLTFLQSDFRHFLYSLRIFYFLYILKASIRKKMRKLYSSYIFKEVTTNSV